MANEKLQEAIEVERARLAALDLERAKASTRLQEMQAQLRELESSHLRNPSGNAHIPVTPGEKVELFGSLFRGRSDVFAKRFVSHKSGKSGYAPTCDNKWVRDVCALPKIKCGECPNQAFQVVSNSVLLDHLRGRHVVGIYPMLKDETCWLLAIDFDKSNWRDDVAALVETCRAVNLEPAVERSRSGNGAHVWFFFSAPVPAGRARCLGSFLITQTMTRRHELAMDSYDRLFPNQDTLPRGGFGNLIALPLQREVRQVGNSVFLDHRLEPHADQWGYLASVQRLSPDRLETIVQEASGNGQILDLRGTATIREDGPAPRPPSGPAGHIPTVNRDSLPAAVEAVLENRLCVNRSCLPAPLVNAIKRLAAFQNPEFYKKQRARLSTALTPRVISCAEDVGHHVSLPRGCLPDVEELLRGIGVTVQLEDRRNAGLHRAFNFRGELTRAQQEMAGTLLPHDMGVVVAPPGSGKTVLGTYMLAQRGCSTLVLVHRQPLLDQWITHLATFLDIDRTEIGQLGGGKRKLNGTLDVAMLQSLLRSDRLEQLVAHYGHVVVDECHHVPASSFERVLSAVGARYLLGLTATPHRRDGHEPIIHMQLGPTRFAADTRNALVRSPFKHRLFVRETAFQPASEETNTSIQSLYQDLATNDARNRMILDDVIAAVDRGRSPLVLTERRDHLDWLADNLRPAVRNLVVLKGGRTEKARRQAAGELAGIAMDEERLVLATGRFIGEGFDDARLDTLFLALPVSWKGTLAQYAGRLHRYHPGKSDVVIVDYVDRSVPMLERMLQKRLRTYKALGYEEEAIHSNVLTLKL